ncbi:thiol-disulfide oxidoreductase DCC family protein [Streptomyces sp. HB2AG]|uniref:thiol-disulfide oxidoreductase DCC family protein n=1 Tax=Streptomyces sp. HB2AG TaxID=2983400 RepID=UPI0022AA5D8E|nr:DCC1-like thiol-disulfide oxidoreductase family protein [Streptomyces sp. HB2AG]MCZ2525318.1 DCC1-like thiol-disulfide oxidoreductase family protein [Streptomyces sp. HB2AG]
MASSATAGAAPAPEPEPEPAPAPAGTPGPPQLRRLTVLHDPACPLCRHLAGWLRRQRQLVPLEFVPVASPEAARRFPGIDQRAAYGEITVVGDTGEFWTGHHAFVTCLWALAEYRPTAHRLSTPAGLPMARAATLAASKYRSSAQDRQWRRAAAGGWRAPGAQGTPGSAALPPRPWQGWGGDSWDGDSWPQDDCDGACPASR